MRIDYITFKRAYVDRSDIVDRYTYRSKIMLYLAAIKYDLGCAHIDAAFIALYET